jgi:hypothetical protein
MIARRDQSNRDAHQMPRFIQNISLSGSSLVAATHHTEPRAPSCFDRVDFLAAAIEHIANALKVVRAYRKPYY